MFRCCPESSISCPYAEEKPHSANPEVGAPRESGGVTVSTFRQTGVFLSFYTTAPDRV